MPQDRFAAGAVLLEYCRACITFLYGPDLPENAVAAFRKKVAYIGFVTSFDIVPPGGSARQLARGHKLDSGADRVKFDPKVHACCRRILQACNRLRT